MGETYASGAFCDLPAESTIVIVVPPKLVGNGPKISPLSVPTPCPLAIGSEPGAMPMVPGVAGERMVGAFDMALTPAVGANATPRNTSPKAAVRMVVNCSLAAEAAVVFASTSVIDTSLFGSAP